MKGVIRALALRPVGTRRALRPVVELDQAIDDRATAPAGPAGSACRTNFALAACASVDTSANHVIVDCMAVANQHAFFIAPGTCKSNSIETFVKTSMIPTQSSTRRRRRPQRLEQIRQEVPAPSRLARAV